MEGAQRRDRIKAGLGAAALQAVFAYALIAGLKPDFARVVSERLTTFNVSIPPPPPPEQQPPDIAATEPEGAAAPPNLRSRPTPVVAPPPEIRLPVPPPIAAAPKRAPVEGSDNSAGAAAVAGPGTGAGGTGSGTGSGGAGTGTGSGLGGRAQRIGGRLLNRDYPRAALAAGAEGVIQVRFVVGTDGRVRGCTVVRSTGNEDLDRTTCRLVEQRFRFRPARDAAGRPIEESGYTMFEWSLPRR